MVPTKVAVGSLSAPVFEETKEEESEKVEEKSEKPETTEEKVEEKTIERPRANTVSEEE